MASPPTSRVYSTAVASQISLSSLVSVQGTCLDYYFIFDDITQYGCPVEEPSPSNPNPQQDTSDGQAPRYRRKSYRPYVSVP